MKEAAKIGIKIAPILKKNGVSKAGIFGSYATGRQKRDSDVDLLVEFSGHKSLFDLAGLKIDLEEKTGKKFDVLTYKSINHLIKEQVLGEEVRIL